MMQQPRAHGWGECPAPLTNIPPLQYYQVSKVSSPSGKMVGLLRTYEVHELLGVRASGGCAYTAQGAYFICRGGMSLQIWHRGPDAVRDTHRKSHH